MTRKKAGSVNAKRIPWKKVGYVQKGGRNFAPSYIEFQRNMSVCYDLVKIASCVLDKPLRLVAGGPRSSPPIVQAATDGKTIFLPKMHPQLRIAAKHEIAHNYFGSDIGMRLSFVHHILDDMEASQKKALPSYLRDRLVNDLCFLINILDDIRVNSLWGMLYPGDGRDMDEWYFGIVGYDMMEKAQNQYKGGDITHLFTYAILRCLGQDAQSSKWGQFEQEIDQAADDVKLKTFSACLLICKNLVRGIARKLAEDEKDEDDSAPAWGPSPEPGDEDGDTPPDLLKSLQGMESGSKPSDDFADHNAGFDFKKSPPNTSALADRLRMSRMRSLKAIDSDDDDAYAAALLLLEDMAIDQVQGIQDKISNVSVGGNYKNEGDFLKKGVKSAVKIVKVKKKDIVPTVLSPEDVKQADRWRKYFLRVMGVLALRTDQSGYEIIPELYIQQKINNEPFECFRRDTTGRGFRVNVLVDMSGSMHSRFSYVQKLNSMLQRALDFNFVHLRTYGFNCTHAGVVNIYDYPKGADGLISPDSQVEGLTPLPQAVRIAGRDLTRHRDDNHLFVLSDGFPAYILAGKRSAVHTGALINWTKDAVKDLQRKKVHTHCFMIGHSTPSPDDMNTMFGHRGWKKIDDSQIYADSFNFIVESFMQYLRRR